MRSRCVLALILTVGALSLCGIADAQNLLSNPGFDGGATSWTDSSDADATAVFSPDDMNAQVGSGSVVVTSYSSIPASEYKPMWQCVGVVEGQRYVLGGWVKIAGGQSETGLGGVTVYWTPNTLCSGWLGGVSAQSSAIGDWEITSSYVEAPASATGAKVFLAVNKTEGGGQLSVSIDGLFFIPILFGDGFESGDYTEWSDAVP